MFRKAAETDIEAIAGLYRRIHDAEEAFLCRTGWQRGIYPTRATAETAVALGDMFVRELDGRILAAGRINREQVDVYAQIPWQYEAPPEKVMVLHTLVVDPAAQSRGHGRAFAAFYEALARREGCSVLRLDTNEKNLRARALYASLGYREAGIVPCVFNGIPGVGLVCLEKTLE